MNFNVVPFICGKVENKSQDNNSFNGDFFGISDSIVINKLKDSIFYIVVMTNGIIDKPTYIHIVMTNLEGDMSRYIGNFNLTEEIKDELFGEKILINNKSIISVDADFPQNVDKVILEIYVTYKKDMDEVRKKQEEINESEMLRELIKSDNAIMTSLLIVDIIKD